jgi:hypothetical protein
MTELQNAAKFTGFFQRQFKRVLLYLTPTDLRKYASSTLHWCFTTALHRVRDQPTWTICRKQSVPLPGIKPGFLGCVACSPVTILTQLSWLSTVRIYRRAQWLPKSPLYLQYVLWLLCGVCSDEVWRLYTILCCSTALSLWWWDGTAGGWQSAPDSSHVVLTDSTVQTSCLFYSALKISEHTRPMTVSHPKQLESSATLRWEPQISRWTGFLLTHAQHLCCQYNHRYSVLSVQLQVLCVVSITAGTLCCQYSRRYSVLSVQPQVLYVVSTAAGTLCCQYNRRYSMQYNLLAPWVFLTDSLPVWNCCKMDSSPFRSFMWATYNQTKFMWATYNQTKFWQ